MTSRHNCSKKIWPGRTSGRMCSRPVTVQFDGKWYCWQHDPQYVEAKAKECRAGWEAKMDREAAKYKHIARNARLGPLVTEELAALLENLASLVHSGRHYEYAEEDIETARTTAASIREALEANDEKAR